MNNFHNIGPKYDYSSFKSFLNNNAIITTALAAAITDRIMEFTELIYSTLLSPYINNSDDKQKNIFDCKISFFGKNIEFGKLLSGIIRFVIMLFFIYLIGKILTKLNHN